MKKIILLGITLVAGLVSCTKDYTDWATPQSNAANDPVQKLEMMVQPTVNSILFANDNGENIQLFTTNLTAEQASEYLLAVSGTDGNTVVDMVADADGKVSVEELEGFRNMGKKSVQEILAMPEWERECWRDVFLIYGPLDWKRSDLLTARVNQYQAAGDAPPRRLCFV